MERAKYFSENGTILGGRDLDASSIDLKTVYAVTPAPIARARVKEKRSMKD